MSSIAQPAAQTFTSELAEKWPFLLVAFLMMLCAFGVPTYALPFVYAGAVDEFGWTRQEAVLLATFKFVTAAVGSVIIGRLLDTLNSKWLVVGCAALGGVGMLAFMLATSLPVYYAIGIVLGCNSAGMAVAMNVLVCRVFERSTGTALGVVLAGTSAAGIIVPLVMAPLMQTFGWRPTMLIMSVAIWLVALPAWLLLLRAKSRWTERLRAARGVATTTGMWPHFKSLSSTPHFWLIVVGIVLVSAVDQGLLQNQVLFLRDEKGLELGTVAWGAALLAAIGIGSKILFGWVYDRISIAGIVLCYALLAVSVGLAFAVTGAVTMIVFMAVRGFAHGGLIVDAPVLAKHYYGPQNAGLNIGLFTLCMSVGFAFGPPLLARMADDSGSYLGGFGLCVAAAVVAAVLLYPIRPRFWTRP